MADGHNSTENTMAFELRRLMQSVAECIRGDGGIKESGRVTVVVEDERDVGAEIEKALASVGVLVLIVVRGYTRDSKAGYSLIGNLEFEIQCYEHPVLNRDGTAWTAQQVMERIVRILHWDQPPGFMTPIRFTNFGRDDAPEANILRATFTVKHSLAVAGLQPQ